MSSDAPDEFTRMMQDAGFEVKDVTDAEQVEETFEYTGLSISYKTDNDLPVTVRVEFPVDHGMDAARALVVSGMADSIQTVLAGIATMGDASVHGYFDANGIDSAKYIEDAFGAADEEPPPLSNADGFFDLDK